MSSESNDSEIINRKRPNARKSSRFEHESISSEIVDHSEIVEGDFEPLFYEIFGNGDEYSYIYKRKNESQENKNVENRTEINASECYSYINCFLRGFSTLFKGFDLELVNELINGYCPEYLSFHLDKMTIKELYFIKDLINDYKEESNRQRPAENDTKTQGILSCSEFVKNMESFETIYMPQGNINLPFNIGSTKSKEGWEYDEIQGLELCFQAPTLCDEDKNNISKHFKKIIAKIATNPTFIKRAVYATIIEILEPDFAKSSVHSLSFLQKLFCTGQNDINDQIRKFIVQKAFETVAIDKNAIEKSLIAQGMVEGSGGLQELVDLVLCLRGRPGTYAGVYLDKSVFSVVKIDSFGNLIDSCIFKEHQLFELQNYLADIANICLTSSTSSVKFALQNAGINFLYVPRKLSFFDDFKDFSVPFNIAIAVQNPVLYFSKLLYCLTRGLPVLNYRSSDIKMLKKAVSIACATTRLDWIETLSHRFGYMIFDLLNIDISDPYFNFQKLDVLESLKHVFDTVKYNNICTYFNHLTSENPLDTTLIHPVNYSMAIVLFKSACHSLINVRQDQKLAEMGLNLEKDTDKIIELFVSQPELLTSLPTMGIDGDKDMQLLSNLKQMLLKENEIYFTGVSDQQIFEDVVSFLEVGKTYQGIVSKVGPDFYICLVSNATVFVKKTGELALNQLVKVEIAGQNTLTLNYSGNIVEEEKTLPDKFRSHPLFKDMPQDILERYMIETSNSFGVRPSSTPGCCCVVCKVENDVFFTFKLTETMDLGNGNIGLHYEFKNKNYKSLTDFINEYVRNVCKLVAGFCAHSHYYKDPSEALKYINEPGEYVKYAIILSRERPGFLEFQSAGKRVFAKIENEGIFIQNRRFGSIFDLVGYIKTHIKTL